MLKFQAGCMAGWDLPLPLPRIDAILAQAGVRDAHVSSSVGVGCVRGELVISYSELLISYM